MRITLEPTEQDEQRRYSETHGVRVERAVGGVLIAFGPGMKPEMHQWGPIPECCQAMGQLTAQLSLDSQAEMARRAIQKQAQQAIQARQQEQIRHQMLTNNGAIHRP